MNHIREASPPPRRLPGGTVRKLLKASLLPLLFGGIFLVVGAGLTVFFLCLGNPLHDCWLSRRSDSAQGTVTETTVTHWRRPSARIIRYDFEANGRRWNGGSFDRSGRVVQGIKPGDEIEVEYLLLRPAISRAKGTKASLFSAWEFSPSVLFAAMGGAILLYGIGKAFRLRNLLINGRAVLAKVTEEKINKLINVGKRRPLDVSYTFQDSRGTDRFGRTRVYFPRAGLEMAPAGEVNIVYDSLNPKRNFAYELYDVDLSER